MTDAPLDSAGRTTRITADANALPVADPWFQVREVDEAITLFREPHVDPWISANIWHIRGQRMDLLIDTGTGVAPLLPEILRRYPGREPVVVLTHAHLDHMALRMSLPNAGPTPSSRPPSTVSERSPALS